MAKENQFRFATLCMLVPGPTSGHQIKKLIGQNTANLEQSRPLGSTAHFWTDYQNETYGQIYPALKQLTDEGLVTCNTENHEGDSEQYVYALTEQGKEELEGLLVEFAHQSIEQHKRIFETLGEKAIPTGIAINYGYGLSELPVATQSALTNKIIGSLPRTRDEGSRE